MSAPLLSPARGLAALALVGAASLGLGIACGAGAGGGLHGPALSGAPDGSAGVEDAAAPSAGDAETPASEAGAAAQDASVDEGAPPPPPFFGGNVEPGGVVFRVWAPHATSASVRGDFATTDAPMIALDGGVFEAHVSTAHAGSSYTFELETGAGALSRVDPYCRQLSAGACVVVDPSTYSWTTPPFQAPARAASVVYELHVGGFNVPPGAAQGTFASVRDGLPQLADLGVNVVELMPVQEFGGGGDGWGYNPQLYFAPKPDYGTQDDFRALVDRAHALGIAVWIDTVVNHMDGWSQAPLRCFDGDCADGGAGIYFFAPGAYATTPWGPRPDYMDPMVAGMLLSSVDAWMGELRVSGFRWDSTSNIRAIDGTGTTPGGQALLQNANDRVHAGGGLSVAEDLKGYAPITQSIAAGGFGFDAQWDGFGYTVASLIVPASDTVRDLGQVVGLLQGGYAGDGFARLLFTEDHDTVGNGGARLPSQIDPQTPTSFAARRRSMLAAALLLTTPGVPMLFMGQEQLAVGTFSNPPAPLAPATGDGPKVRAFYRDMIRLRRDLDGASGGLSDTGVEIVHRNDTAKVIGYRRFGASGEEVLVVLNLANKAYTEYDVGVADASPWRVRMNDDLPAYGSDFTGTQTGSLTPVAKATDGKAYSLPLALGAYGAMVLTR